MTAKEVQERVLAGTPTAVVEYRGSKCDVIEWRDKESGKMRTFTKLMHNVETEKEAFQVSERTDDSFKPEAYKPPFKKGQKVVWLIDGLSRAKGVVSASGALVALEA